MELVISIALFALVAGLVLSFVLSIVSFNRQSQNNTAHATAALAFRKQVDYWFSYFDTSDYEIEITVNGSGLVKVTATKDESESEIYTIRHIGADVTFTYPETEEANSVTVSFPETVQVYFAKYDGAESGKQQDADRKELRFTIDGKVSGNTYLCVVAYE